MQRQLLYTCVFVRARVHEHIQSGLIIFSFSFRCVDCVNNIYSFVGLRTDYRLNIYVYLRYYYIAIKNDK